MPSKKKQHYVPKLYMKNFADERGLFNVYNIDKRRLYKNVPYKNQCQRPYFYGIDNGWEDFLSREEDSWCHVIRKTIRGESLESSDINSIKTFAVYQRQRTLAELNFHIKERENLMLEYAKMVSVNRNIPITDLDIKYIKEFAKKEVNPNFILELCKDLIDVINDLEVTIIHYETDQNLISSDAPVIAINPFFSHGIGYGCMGLIMFFPISPKTLVVTYDSKLYGKYKGKMYFESTDEEEVHKLNVMQFLSAEQILFANDYFDIPSFSEEELDLKRMNNTPSVSSLGSDSNKLIAMSLRRIIHEYEFSFGEMRRCFKRIPYECREAIPREYDKNWEEKLIRKGRLLTDLRHVTKSIDKESDLSFGQLTPKEFRRGCNRFATEAKKYWFDY